MVISRGRKEKVVEEGKKQMDTDEMKKILTEKRVEIEKRCLERVNEVLKEECCVLSLELQLIPVGENIFKQVGQIKIVYSE